MTSKQLTYILLILLSLSGCGNTEMTEEKILSDIFPQLVDSIWIRETNLIPPPPPPLYDQDSNFIGIDTLRANMIIKEHEQRLRIIDSVDSRLLIGLIDTCLPFQPSDFENRTYSNDNLIRRIIENNPNLVYKTENFYISQIRVPSDIELLLLSDLKSGYNDFWEIDNRRFGGLIGVSKVLLNKEHDLGLLKVETYPFHRDGAGYFIIIENINNKWIIKKVYHNWVS